MAIVIWLTCAPTFRRVVFVCQEHAVKYLDIVRVSEIIQLHAVCCTWLSIGLLLNILSIYANSDRRYDGDVNPLEDSTNDAADVGRIVRPVFG